MLRKGTAIALVCGIPARQCQAAHSERQFRMCRPLSNTGLQARQMSHRAIPRGCSRLLLMSQFGWATIGASKLCVAKGTGIVRHDPDNAPVRPGHPQVRPVTAMRAKPPRGQSARPHPSNVRAQILRAVKRRPEPDHARTWERNRDETNQPVTLHCAVIAVQSVVHPASVRGCHPPENCSACEPKGFKIAVRGKSRWN